MTELEEVGSIELIGGPLDGEIIDDPGVEPGEEFVVQVTRQAYWGGQVPKRRIKPEPECVDVEPWVFNKQAHKLSGHKVWDKATYQLGVRAQAKFRRMVEF